jgi:hypothetical protein
MFGNHFTLYNSTMKKPQAKILRGFAAQVPALFELRPGALYRWRAGKIETDERGKRMAETGMSQYFPVNHFRRMKRAFLRGGEDAVVQYVQAVQLAAPKQQAQFIAEKAYTHHVVKQGERKAMPTVRAQAQTAIAVGAAGLTAAALSASL